MRLLLFSPVHSSQCLSSKVLLFIPYSVWLDELTRVHSIQMKRKYSWRKPTLSNAGLLVCQSWQVSAIYHKTGSLTIDTIATTRLPTCCWPSIDTADFISRPHQQTMLWINSIQKIMTFPVYSDSQLQQSRRLRKNPKIALFSLLHLSSIGRIYYPPSSPQFAHLFFRSCTPDILGN